MLIEDHAMVADKMANKLSLTFARIQSLTVMAQHNHSIVLSQACVQSMMVATAMQLTADINRL
jgi:hypothetical protein